MSIKKDVVIVAGMPRGGSTWLYRNLSNHPHSNTSDLKETNFFSINFDKGESWYRSLYDKNLSSDHIKFDVSPFYFLDPDFTKNVVTSGYTPKVILTLREPNEWIRSLYYQIKSYTLNMPPFEQFMKKHTIKFDGKARVVKLSEFDFLGKVQELSQIFKGNLMLINFDLIKRDPVYLLQQIEQFSGLPAYFNKETIISSQINASQAKFSLLGFLSSLKPLRSVANILPFKKNVIKSIQKKLYKEGKQSLFGIQTKANSPDQKYTLLKDKDEIDSLFPPVYKNTFFKKSDIVYL